MPMISSLKSWFASKKRADQVGPMRPPLSLERLEDRSVPAIVPGLNIGKPTNTGTAIGSQSEPAIAIDPTNSRRIFVAANNNNTIAQGLQGLYASYSVDGGTTWNPRQIAFGTDLAAGNTDPTVAWDNFGNLFFCYFDPANPVLVINVSADGGRTFTTISNTIPIVDQPTVTVGAGFVWVSYLGPQQVQQAAGARVFGLGPANIGAFTVQNIPGSPLPTNPVRQLNFGDISIGPNGQVMVGFQENLPPPNNPGPANMYFSIDPDGLLGPLGFTPLVTLPNQPAPLPILRTNVGGFLPIPAQPQRTIDAELGLAYDRSAGPNRGRLYLVYTDRATAINAPQPSPPNVGGDVDTNIFLRYSDNNGLSWTQPLRVNDDTIFRNQFVAFGEPVAVDVGTTLRSQFFSKIAVDQTTGYVAMSWYDCRLDPGFGFYDTDGIPNTDMVVFATLSVNGGRSLYRNIQLGNGPSNSIAAIDTPGGNANNGGNEFGDYMGLAFSQGIITPAWVDNSATLGGNNSLPSLDVATARITLLPPQARIFNPLRYTTTNGGATVTGTFTVTNVGQGFFSESILLLFPRLPRGVTVRNATGLINGVPFIRLNVGLLGRNTPFRVTVVFNNPLKVPISTFFVGLDTRIFP